MLFYIFIISSLLISILSVSLGSFVWIKDIKRNLNRAFFLMNLSIGIWSFGLFMKTIATNKAEALLWTKFFYIGAILLPIFYSYFIATFLGTNRFTKRILYGFSFLCCAFLFFNFTDLFVRDLIYKPFFIYWTAPGPLFPIFVLYFFTCIAYALYLLFNSYGKSSGFKKNQIKYILVASLIAFLGGATDYLSIFDISVYPFGHPFILAYPPIIAYAITQHHLMDINIVIRKGTVYTYLSFLIFVPCMIITIFAQKYFFGQANPLFTFLVFCTLLLTSLVILRVKPEIEEYIEKTLFKRKYEYKKALSELSSIVISFLDEKELFKKAGNILTKDLGIQSISFYLLDREKRAYTLRASQDLNKPQVREFPRTDPFFQWLQEKRKAVVKEVLERSIDDPSIKPIVEKLDSMESEVCIPLMARDELIGIINLGHKRSGEMYSHEDLDSLTHFATQASVALENARLYQEMQRTHMLMRRSDRLASLGSLTAGLTHEIRNPLSTIKTFLDLFPQRYRDKEFRGDFLKLTSSELDRISTLVSELLSFARPTKPTVTKRYINEVLEEVIHLVAVEANKRDIAIDTNLHETPKATLDEDQMKQVFLNIFLNAIDAISEHGRISVTSRDIQKNGKEYVQVEIADTGKGIPKKILDSIFDPFFTTKAKGSGLGLAISHQIVQEHHGTIEVESRAKKGTTFVVNIPSKT
jgi:two-component system NtrC family sensor kinase